MARMSLGPRLELGQRQSLVMTPQLQQAIKLLQLSQIELATYVEGELERNPLLTELNGSAPSDAPEPEAPAPVEAMPSSDSATILRDGNAALTDAPVAHDGEEYRDLGGDGSIWSGVGAGGGHGGEDWSDPLARLPDEDDSLVRHALRQISLEFTDSAERLIAARLADLLEPSGWLGADEAEAVRQALDVARAAFEAILARLRRMDPPGLFSRTLSECLGAQLADRDRLDPAMAALLDNLELLGRRDLAGLQRRCGVDAEDLTDMVAELRALDPKPGLKFDSADSATVIPDLFLRPARHPEQGEVWEIELNSDVLPKVLVDRRYATTLTRAARDKEAKEFLAERLQSANWLVKALDQRATTILKVAKEIVRQQEGFFRKGVSALRPLVLRDIAIAVEMHESTVSRVTSHKYMATPRGTFELKYFFTAAIPSRGGAESVSAESVRSRIRGLISAEPVSETLSDDRIVELLRGEGVDIARRTVAKYREAMRIPSSVQRRREKSIQMPVPAPIHMNGR